MISTIKRGICRDVPGSPVVKTRASNAGGAGSIPGQGTKIPHAVQLGQKKERHMQVAGGPMGLGAGVDQKNSTEQSVGGLHSGLVSGVRKDEQAE